MKRKVVFLLSVASAFLLCSSAFGEETVKVVGSGSSQTLLREVAAAFMKSHPGVTVEVPDSSGTGGGIRGAGEGTADLGRVARKLQDNEMKYGLEYLPFAKTHIIIAANTSVGIKGITSAQSRDIFNGTITNWKEVGGPDMKIRVVCRYEGESSLSVLKSTIQEWKDIVFTPNAKYGGTDQEAVDLVAGNKGAVGFCPLGEAAANNLIPLSLDGKKPGFEDYPIYNEFAFVYKPGRLAGATKDFVDFIFSPEGAEVIRANNAIQVTR